MHLRTPGQEYKENLETGTAAAAAGGFCAVIAMPNTDPVVDDASVLGSLTDARSATASVPVGFLAAITRGLNGEELTEMAELATPARSASPTTASRSSRRARCARRSSTSGCAAG